MSRNKSYQLAPINAEDETRLKAMRFPNSYAFMTHLGNDGMVEDLIEFVGLTKEELHQTNGTMSGLPFKQLLDINIDKHDSPIPYSLSVVKAFNLATHGMLGLAVASSKNLRGALDLLARYTPLINPALSVKFETDSTCTYCYMDCDAAFGDVGAVLIEISMMVLKQLISQSKQNTNPRCLGFSHRSVAASHYFEEFFQCPVSFNETNTCMVLDNEKLDSPMLFYDVSTASTLEQHLNSALDKYKVTTKPWSSETKRYIQDNLQDYDKLSKESVANYLNVTPRTLSRKLLVEDTSYQQLLEAIRFSGAKRALLDSTKSITEIAYELGFREPQAFARAFKRWAGTSASEYRANRCEVLENNSVF